jgi:hypothetical protein
VTPTLIDAAFIPEGLGQAKAVFTWKGLGSHIGPVDRPSTMTPLLSHKTTAALQSIAADLLLWGGFALGRARSLPASAPETALSASTGC